ncbi:unnamed protein product [Cuscuta epithymum]|uniref:Uncharacterized protein n=1 Tax=Cuscuta epithymum TaxID=186058 RepID=A0AAV0CJD7_9ASTE|nr:unnamed protein product [Cuscuta epithymum]
MEKIYLSSCSSSKALLVYVFFMCLFLSKAARINKNDHFFQTTPQEEEDAIQVTNLGELNLSTIVEEYKRRSLSHRIMIDRQAPGGPDPNHHP